LKFHFINLIKVNSKAIYRVDVLMTKNDLGIHSVGSFEELKFVAC